MYSNELESLINASIADGELTKKEREVLTNRAIAEGVDLDEFKVYLNGRLAQREEEIAKEKRSQRSKAEACRDDWCDEGCCCCLCNLFCNLIGCGDCC